MGFLCVLYYLHVFMMPPSTPFPSYPPSFLHDGVEKGYVPRDPGSAGDDAEEVCSLLSITRFERKVKF
jgi:hypothetical protein